MRIYGCPCCVQQGSCGADRSFQRPPTAGWVLELQGPMQPMAGSSGTLCCLQLWSSLLPVRAGNFRVPLLPTALGANCARELRDSSSTHRPTVHHNQELGGPTLTMVARSSGSPLVAGSLGIPLPSLVARSLEVPLPATIAWSSGGGQRWWGKLIASRPLWAAPKHHRLKSWRLREVMDLMISVISMTKS